MFATRLDVRGPAGCSRSGGMFAVRRIANIRSDCELPMFATRLDVRDPAGCSRFAVRLCAT